MISILEKKQVLRKTSKELRKKAFNEYGHNAAILMAKHFKNWFKNKKTIEIIAFYYPIKTEVDPFPIINCLNGPSLKLCLPVVNGPGLPLVFKEWVKNSKLVSSSYGTKIPSRGKLLTPDLVITPLLAFDHLGFRLGYGGGFYDRTIQKLRLNSNVLVLGLAFECQRTDTSIPAEPTDQLIDCVLTERGVYSFRGNL